MSRLLIGLEYEEQLQPAERAELQQLIAALQTFFNVREIEGTNTGDQTITLTNDLVGSGTSTVPATIVADAVTNTKLADMAQARIKGRAAGAGTGDPTDLTADQVSTLLDAAADPFLRTSAAGGGGGGGLTLLEQHAASSSASLDFTSWYSSTYDEYLISIVGLIPATDGAQLLGQFSTDGGSSFAATNYKYTMSYGASSGTTGISASNAGTSIPVSGTVENTTSTSFLDSTIHLYNPGSATRAKRMRVYSDLLANDGNYYQWSGTGAWNDVTAVNALRFIFTAGNVAEGTIRIYGLEK